MQPDISSAAQTLAGQLIDAVLAGDHATVTATLMAGMGLPRHAHGRGAGPKAVICRWICPTCDGTGRAGDGGRCYHCAGVGLTNDADPAVWPDLRPAPVPPAVMRSPCVDCAYRPGSPESETGCATDASSPFFCHHGLHRLPDGGYESTAYVAGLPLGAMVCASWWAIATGQPRPQLAAFRDPGGADRGDAAPEVPR